MAEQEQRTAKINFRLEDKIGLGPPSYSSIVYGLSITRDVPDDGDIETIKAETKVISEMAEEFMVEERQNILDYLQGNAFAEVKK